jgi:hypothetical protein
MAAIFSAICRIPVEIRRADPDMHGSWRVPADRKRRIERRE